MVPNSATIVPLFTQNGLRAEASAIDVPPSLVRRSQRQFAKSHKYQPHD